MRLRGGQLSLLLEQKPNRKVTKKTDERENPEKKDGKMARQSGDERDNTQFRQDNISVFIRSKMYAFTT